MKDVADKTGGPAFPLETTYGNAHGQEKGMSLRDYFAGQALAGMCAITGVDWGGPHGVAMAAYDLADAMLKEREVKP